MHISKDKAGKLIRAMIVSGLLGAAGLTATATPAFAGTETSDGASDGTSDGASDGATDDTDTTTDTSDVGADDSSLPATDNSRLPETGGDVAVPLLLGGTAVGIVLAGRRILASQA